MITQYSSIRAELKTGDIVLFSGKSAFSNIIKYGTMSKWSHVGLVLNIPEYDFLTVWEATTLNNIVDLDTQTPTKGVQLVPLSDRVQKYSGDISIRQLRGADLPASAVADLMRLRKALRGKPYERGKMELFKAAYDGPCGDNNEDLSSIFCSELVAEAYQSLGLLEENTPSSEYTPGDFSEKRMTRLAGDFYLSEEITIKDE